MFNGDRGDAVRWPDIDPGSRNGAASRQAAAERGPPAAPRAGDSSRDQPAATAPSVLVIDGDRRYRTLVEQELAAAGFQVLIVPGEQSGRRTLERGDVDVVVVDPSQADLPDVDLLA